MNFGRSRAIKERKALHCHENNVSRPAQFCDSTYRTGESYSGQDGPWHRHQDANHSGGTYIIRRNHREGANIPESATCNDINDDILSQDQVTARRSTPQPIPSYRAIFGPQINYFKLIIDVSFILQHVALIVLYVK